MGDTCRRLLAVLVGTTVLWCGGFGVAAAATNWVVAATSGANAQAQSQPIPTAPTGLTPTCVTPTGATVKLTWSAVAHATSYTIYRSTTSSTTGFTATATGVTGTSWTSGTLSNATYWWRITVSTGTNWTSAQSATSTTSTIHATGTKCTVP